MGIVLSVSDLSFSYDQDDFVWSNISLDVHTGEILSILGPNGTGKSTLMRCMAGLATPNSGEVEIEGQPLQKLNRKKISQAIAFVPQMHNPIFAFPAIDVVVMGRTAHLGSFAAPSKHDYEIALNAMVKFEIGHLAEKPYNKTSGGERQLLLFARAIAQEARILLLDEPTSHLDFGNQARIMEFISDLAKQGLAVVMTTHFPDHALTYSNRTALLADGILQGFGLTDKVVNAESLSKLYKLDVEINLLKDDRLVCVAKP
ncbi:MAG: ABC transporter ATP-binding protein [Desulfotalea sp.]